VSGARLNFKTSALAVIAGGLASIIAPPEPIAGAIAGDATIAKDNE
jgi:hypothetical protein